MADAVTFALDHPVVDFLSGGAQCLQIGKPRLLLIGYLRWIK